MATLTIRNLSDDVRQALRERAAKNNRSMEAEVRSILEAAALPAPGFIRRWVENGAALRGEFEPPERRAPREFSL